MPGETAARFCRLERVRVESGEGVRNRENPVDVNCWSAGVCEARV